MQELLGALFGPLIEVYEGWPEPVQLGVGICGALIVLAIVLLRSIKIIPQGELGIRKRLGKPILHYSKDLSREEVAAQKEDDKAALARGPVAIYGRPIYMPAGWNWTMPWISVDAVSVKLNTVMVDDVVIMATQALRGEIYRNVGFTFEVTDAYLKYRFEKHGDYLKACVNTNLTVLLRSKGYENLIHVDPKGLLDELQDGLGEELERAGVKIIGLHLGSSMPVPETIIASAMIRYRADRLIEPEGKESRCGDDQGAEIVHDLVPGAAMISLVRVNQ